MTSSAVMNPAYYLPNPAPIQPKPGRRTQPARISMESDYSLVKPTGYTSSKNKTFLGIFLKDKNSKKRGTISSRKAKETDIHAIAHGVSAWK